MAVKPNRLERQRQVIAAKDQPLVSRLPSHEEMLEITRYTLRESFADFVRYFWGVLHKGSPLVWNWHMDAMCEHLQAQSEGKMQRLIINVPPGAGKSILVGVYWPCWEWTRRPTLQTIATAASADLAIRDNQRAKWLLSSKEYQKLFPMELKTDSNSNSKFTNDSFGFRSAVPFTSITGHRGDRVIIDDPISASNANSDTIRENVISIYRANITTRINDPKASTITIVQQRLHERDLVGYLLDNDDRFYRLILPMEFTKEYHLCSNSIGWQDPRKKAGELLFPQRWGPDEVKGYKDEGTYFYSSQFQQNPIPDSDGFFAIGNFQRYKPSQLPKNLHYYMTSDHSLGGSDRSDYNVVRVWGVDEHKNLWMVDSLREKCSLQAAMGIATTATGKLTIGNKGALFFAKKYQIMCWFAEPDNNFKTIQGMIQDTMRSSSIYCRIEHAIGHNNNKESKAAAYQAMSQVGKIYLPVGDVGDNAVNEYAKFPKGTHDDQVDCDAILARMIASSHAAVVPPSPKKKDSDGYVFDGDDDGVPDNWHTWF